MSSSRGCGKWGCLPTADKWRGWFRTAKAMIVLGSAQLVVDRISFHRWRNTLGFGSGGAADSSIVEAEARRLAANVERAAARLPFATKCLPRAMALSWLLRRRRLGHTVVLAVRPAEMRDSPDALHAWVEVNGARVIGDLPGPWVETVRLGA
jgi:hypothetical protein